MYRVPQQMGPANVLHAEPTGYRSTMVGFTYDDLQGWRGPYPAEEFSKQFETITQGWNAGLRHFENTVAASTGKQRTAAESDLSLARAVYLHFASATNQVRFVFVRDALSQANISDEQKRQLRQQIQQILESEITLASDLFSAANQDSRIGYEASNHYFYVPQDLVEKVINCEYLKRRFGE